MVTKERVWFPRRGLAELGESQGLSPVLGSGSPTREGILQRPTDKCCLSLCVYPALPTPVGAQEDFALLAFWTDKRHKHGKDLGQPRTMRVIQSPEHAADHGQGLGESRGPG